MEHLPELMLEFLSHEKPVWVKEPVDNSVGHAEEEAKNVVDGEVVPAAEEAQEDLLVVWGIAEA
jgi:hypothetical protein